MLAVNMVRAARNRPASRSQSEKRWPRGILTACIAADRQVELLQFRKTCRRSGDSFGASYRGSRMSRLGRGCVETLAADAAAGLPVVTDTGVVTC